MSAPFQNGNVLAQNYPQYHREGHFKQIARQNRNGNGHLLGFPFAKGITVQALALSQTREWRFARNPGALTWLLAEQQIRVNEDIRGRKGTAQPILNLVLDGGEWVYLVLCLF